MRRLFTRVLVSLITFTVGLCCVLLWRSVVDLSVRRGAGRVWTGGFGTWRGDRARAGRRVLFDKLNFQDDRDMSLAELEAVGEVERERTRQVAPKVFPAGYLTYSGLCEPEVKGSVAQSEFDLAWARAHGQIVAWVPLERKGSFTAAGADETLYEIQVGECNAHSGPLEGGSEQFAVFHDGALRASCNTLMTGGLYGIQDTDDDGVAELLLGQTEVKQSSFVTTFRLVSLKGGVWRVVHDFGGVYIYGPEPYGPGSLITAPVITYTPGDTTRPPEFHLDFYRARCRRDEHCKFWPRADAWQYVKSGSLD